MPQQDAWRRGEAWGLHRVFEGILLARQMAELCVDRLIDDTHAAFAQFFDDAVVGDGQVDQDGDIVPPPGLLLVTIDVTNKQLFFGRRAPSAWVEGPPRGRDPSEVSDLECEPDFATVILR